MNELEPITVDTLGTIGADPPGGADDWQRVLDLVTAWLAEHRGNSRTSYADAIGYPINVRTGEHRDVSTLRNGVAWLPWCLMHRLNPLEARRTHVVAWINTLEATPHPDSGEMLSKGTRAQMVSVVSAFYKHLAQEGYVEVNPVQINRKKLGVSTSGDASPTRSLTRDEVTALQLAADHDRMESVRLRSSAIVAVLFGVGMRASELVGLNLDDLRVVQGVRAVPLRVKGGRVDWRRIPDVALGRLDAYLASRPDIDRRPARRGQVGNAAKPVFTTASGRRLHRTAVNDLLQRLAKAAGLADPTSVHPHVARHSFITAGRLAGVSNSDLQRLVGHRDGKTTERYGLHAIDLSRSQVNAIANSYLPPLHRTETGE